MKRFLRSAVIFVFLSGMAPGVSAAGHYLLVTEQQLEQARRKAERHAWAAGIERRLFERADAALGRKLEIPDRGGQWPHWYSCPRDGVKLETVSPSEHRCPKCDEVYSGDPYDAVVLYHVHRSYSGDVRDLGLAFRLSGDERYAGKAREILLAYAERYESYRLHNIHGEEKIGGGRIMAQTLDESVWLIPVAFAYALVKETLAPEERQQIEQGLFLPAAAVIRQHEMKIHNIQCWKNSAVGLAGFVTGDQELIDEAIGHPIRGFRAQVENGITPEGLWYEGSLGYHYYTMDALWPLAEAARNQGIDLYTDRYRSLYEAPITLALPDGAAPGFNDNAGGSVFRAARHYELAYARWRRPEFGSLVARVERNSIESLLYGVAELPSGPVVPESSAYLPGAGYAMLRSPAMTAAFRFGMHGGGHGHPDKLNVVTYGSGRLGGLDPGSINYGVPLHREWYKSTIAHNTVSVDQEMQEPVDGEARDWSDANGITRITGYTDKAYPGVMLTRSLSLDGKKLADVFECRSAGEHTYDWAFHAPGSIAVNVPLAAASGPAGGKNGYQHVSLSRRGVTGEDFAVSWDLGGRILTIEMEGEPGTELLVGSGPGRDPADPVDMIIVRRRAKETSFRATHRFSE